MKPNPTDPKHPSSVRSGSYPLVPLVTGIAAAWLLCGAPLQAAGEHLDPLRAISGRHQETPRTHRTRPRRPARHYNPLEALNGKLTPQDRTAAARETTAPDPQPRSPSRTHTQSVRPHTPAPSADTHRLVPQPHTASSISSRTTPPQEHAEPTPPDDPTAYRIETVEDAPDDEAIITNPPDREHDSERLSETQLMILLKGAPIESPAPAPKAYHAPKEKTLYMTFDDGPIGGTANLLRVLREENVEATMFYIGREVHHSPALFHQALSMPNILVANHTYTHANNHYRRFYNSSVAHVVADIDKAQAAIGGAKYLRLCGRNVWRLPTIHRDDWGISVAQRGHEIPKYNALYRRGYFIYGWDVEWAFSYKTQRPLFSGEEMARRVNLSYIGHHTVKPGKVIMLAHDFMFRSAYNSEQLRTFIRIMKGQGWHFRTIDDYSRHTPDAYVRPAKPTRTPALRPAQKLAQQATILVPGNRPQIDPSSLRPRPNDAASRLSAAIRRQSFLEIRRLLARHEADINTPDPQGHLPLNLAIRTNNAILVRMLVERGARIFNIDAEGMSPMGVAREQNNAIIIRYLKHQITLQHQRRLQQTVFASHESISR